MPGLSNTHKWVCIDIEQEKFKWVYASSHREAVAKAVTKYGIVTHRPEDCNAASGFPNKMDSQQLNRFLDKLRKEDG